MGRLQDSLQNYFASLAIIWAAIFLYTFNSYYTSFLFKETLFILQLLALSYSVLALPLYLMFYRESFRSKGYLFFRSSKKFFHHYKDYTKHFPTNPSLSFPRMERHEKTAVLFIFVKLFYLPVMLNFFVDNFYAVKNNFPSFAISSFFTADFFLFTFFPFALSMLFLIDTVYFAFGYAFEAKFLKNKVRSVEPTFFGWAVALACYPPFNSVVTNFTGWYANNYNEFWNIQWTIFFRILMLLFLAVYVWATLSLGTRCSNLTNRGIVSRGAYRWIRHPAYIAKNLMWWIAIIPVFHWRAALAMASWSFIYYWRAITEERHLSMDPDYVEYSQKVKYRFIPFVW